MLAKEEKALPHEEYGPSLRSYFPIVQVLFRAMGDSISHDDLATENDLPHVDLVV